MAYENENCVEEFPGLAAREQQHKKGKAVKI
jgi:hypothetical protein